MVNVEILFKDWFLQRRYKFETFLETMMKKTI